MNSFDKGFINKAREYGVNEKVAGSILDKLQGLAQQGGDKLSDLGTQARNALMHQQIIQDSGSAANGGGLGGLLGGGAGALLGAGAGHLLADRHDEKKRHRGAGVGGLLGAMLGGGLGGGFGASHNVMANRHEFLQ